MKRLSLVLLLAPAAAFVGCDVDLFPEDDLNLLEAQVAAEIVASLAEDAIDEAVARALSATDADVGVQPLNMPFELTFECPGGGSGAVDGILTGTVDRAAGDLEAAFDGEYGLSDCRFSGGGSNFLLATDAPLMFEGDVQAAAGTVVAREIRQTGALRWSSGDRGGVCDIDLTTTADGDAGERRIFGTFCGRGIDRTQAWSPEA